MVRYSFAAAFVFAATVFALPTPQSGSTINTSAPGAENVGKGDGSQFITGQCFSNADCATDCCAGLNGAGVCSAVAVSTASGKTGCGFDVTGSTTAAARPSASAASTTSSSSTGSASNAGNTVNESEPGAENVGKANGSQFITGQCFSNADCASGCCATLNGAGQCSGPDVSFASGKEGCGFVAS